jgi:uncharacterized protein
MEAIERRYIDGLTVEDRGEGKDKGITGLGIVFNHRSVNLGGFVEVIKPEAMNGIELNDIVSMVNHDPNKVVGRSPDTLGVKIEPDGVRYTIEPSETSTYKDLAISVTRGDIKGSSFGFIVERNGEDWTEDENGIMVRTITKFRKIFDLSPVVFPAYSDTTVAKRSMDEFLQTKNQEVKQFSRGRAEKELEIIKLKNK